MLQTFTTYWEQTPGAWTRLWICIGLFVFTVLASTIVRKTVVPRVIARAEKGRSVILKVVSKGFAKPFPVIVWVVGVYLAITQLPLPLEWRMAVVPGLSVLVRIALICLIAWGLMNSSDVGPLLMQSMQGKLDVNTDKTVTTFFNKLLRGIIFVFALVMVLGELNYDVNGLIAGMGLAGLTISMAAKDSATNFFGGLVIIFEKPFSLEDWVTTSGAEGTVEDISFRSTKIRTLDGSLVVVPNSVLCNDCIVNGSQRDKRIYRFNLGVTYSTSRAQIEQLCAALRKMLAEYPLMDADSVQVRLQAFGASSIDLLVSGYLRTPAMPDFLKAQEELNLSLLDIMQEQGVEFAFPSQSIYIEKAGEN